MDDTEEKVTEKRCGGGIKNGYIVRVAKRVVVRGVIHVDSW